MSNLTKDWQIVCYTVYAYDNTAIASKQAGNIDGLEKV